MTDSLKRLDLALMKKFNGKWEWKTDKESFTMILKTEKFGEIPLVCGWYQYKKNGKLIIHGLADVVKINKPTIAGYSKKGNPLLTISLLIPRVTIYQAKEL